MGDVELRNVTTFDNKLAGVEFSKILIKEDGKAKVNGGRIITYTNNLNETDRPTYMYGVISPRTDWFTVENVKFYKFNSSNAALSTCSHCLDSDSTDSGARTITTNNLTFDTISAANKIFY